MESRFDDGARTRQFPKPPVECRTEMLLPDQVEFARRAFERFLVTLSELLPSYLYTPAAIRFAGAEQCPLSEALSHAGQVGCVVLLDLTPYANCARLTFGHTFLCAALETLLGAPADVGLVPRETLTELDLRILHGLVDLAVGELRNAWQAKCAAQFRKISMGAPDPIVADQDDQNVLVLTADIAMGESTDTLRLMLPSLFIRLVSQFAGKSAAPAADTERRALTDALGAASLEVEAVLRGGDIRVRDLLALKPGLILELPQKSGTAIECQINGVSKLRGELVNSGKYVGFQIESWQESADPGEASR